MCSPHSFLSHLLLDVSCISQSNAGFVQYSSGGALTWYERLLWAYFMFIVYRSTQEKVLGDTAGRFRGTPIMPYDLEHM